MYAIASTGNPHVKLARSLHEAKGRARHGAFLIEGLRLVEAAAAVRAPRLVLYTPEFAGGDARADSLLRRIENARAELRLVTERVMAHVSDTVAPPGIVAVVPFPDAPAPRLDGPPLDLILDQVSDPGNAGTLLRTAAATRVGCVTSAPGTVDLYAPKTVRAGAGAHFMLAIFEARTWDEIAPTLAPGTQVILAEASAQRRSWDVDWRLPSALIVSNEARGASNAARNVSTDRISIPLAPGVESLNAGVAGSIILYEALRQRTTAGVTK
ncbi:MAG: TrmH family RNA methyltransferase [Chloroflexota bacterium]